MAKPKQKNDTLSPKKLGYKVSHVNFEKKDDKKFSGAIGLCEFNEKRIYIDKSLPDRNDGSKKLCLNHELVHARIGDLLTDNGFSSEDEERYVEIEAICWTGTKYLSSGESEVKKSITGNGKLNIRKKGQRREVVLAILSFLGIKMKPKLLNQLSEKIIDRGDENVES